MTAVADVTGAYDMHVHAAPDVIPRFVDDLELARRARDARLGGIVLKSHQGSTAERAYLASRAVPGANVYGGLVLNDPVGGLNPAAVETALRLGAKEIWMPTASARNHRRFFGHDGGISIFDADGALKPEVHEILRLVAEADVILGTGHLSSREVDALVSAASSQRVRKILITHPELHFTWLDVDMQLLQADRGAFFERCLICTTPQGGATTIARIAAHIRRVGPASTVLATDYGQPYNPCPIEGLKMFMSGLLEQGISEREIERMAKSTPKSLLAA